MTLYIDPASLTNEAASTPYIQDVTQDIGSVYAFRAFAGGSQSGGAIPAAVGSFDEVRFGTSYASVTSAVPEPSTYAMGAGLAALFAGFIYRRRRAARG